jgi:hypothetical protein
MAILYGSENESMRDRVVAVLKRASKQKSIKVLDAGGGYNSWLGEFVTHILDINPRIPVRNIELIQGDINEIKTWNQIEKNYFDFVSSTHTLEDIRDPKFVINQFNRVARSGFIETPNRQSEFKAVESLNYLGYAHHRWIFHLREPSKLEAVAKWVGISNKRVLLEHFLGRKKSLFKRNLDKILPPELRSTKTNFLALGLVWTGGLNFEYLDNDFAGTRGSVMKSNALNFLSEPFVNFESRLNWENDLYKSIIQDL